MSEWRRRRAGKITSNFAESGAFFRSRDEIEIPDVQLHFVIGIVDNHGRRPRLGHGFSCHISVLRPKSRGTATLNSPDPRVAPCIDPRFFSDSEDMDTILEGGAVKMQEILELLRSRLSAERCSIMSKRVTSENSKPIFELGPTRSTIRLEPADGPRSRSDGRG